MAKVEPGMESMLEMYIFETNTLLEQLDEILLRTEDANVFSQEDINEIFRISPKLRRTHILYMNLYLRFPIYTRLKSSIYRIRGMMTIHLPTSRKRSKSSKTQRKD